MFTLEVNIHTDDDAELLYEGKLFCFYGPDLKIRKKFKTRNEAVSHLKEIKVIAGRKFSNPLVEMFENEIIPFLENHDTFESHGNHAIEIEIYKEEDFKDYLKEKQIPIFPWSSQARGFFLDGLMILNHSESF